MIVLIDNFDSFVYNLARYVVEAGHSVQVIRNNSITVDALIDLNPKGILISPGPCSPNEAGISLEVIEKLHTRFPILGVCLGHQAIGQVFGGTVKRSIMPVHGKSETIDHTATGIFDGIDSPTVVTRYHSLIVDTQDSPDLVVTSRTDAGEVMAFHHKKYPVYGVQFHPEAILTQDGHQMIRNFLKVCL